MSPVLRASQNTPRPAGIQTMAGTRVGTVAGTWAGPLLLAVFALLHGVIPGIARAAKPAAAAEIEEVEPDTVDDDGDGEDEDEEPPGPLETFSRLHPAVVHMPVAWLWLLFLTDIAALALGRRELLTAGIYLAVLTLLSFAPAVATGLLRLEHLPQDPAAMAPALIHRNIMLIGAGLCTVFLTLRLWRRNRLAGVTRWIYLLLVTATLFVITVGGHLGGKLVYGDDYLPF